MKVSTFIGMMVIPAIGLGFLSFAMFLLFGAVRSIFSIPKPEQNPRKECEKTWGNKYEKGALYKLDLLPGKDIKAIEKDYYIGV